jgi:hypothetical protein
MRAATREIRASREAPLDVATLPAGTQ